MKDKCIICGKELEVSFIQAMIGITKCDECKNDDKFIDNEYGD